MTKNTGLLRQYKGYGGRKLHVFPHGSSAGLGDVDFTIDTGNRTFEIRMPVHEVKEMTLYLIEKCYGVKFSEEDLEEFRAAEHDQ